MLKAEWWLIEFVQISGRSDTSTGVLRSPSAPAAGHSCHPPNPHFVTLPILISFSQVFLLVFPISTFMIFLMCINWWTKNNSVIQTKLSHVVLMPQSAVGLEFEKRILRLIYGRSLYQILPSPILCSSSFKTDNPWQRLTSLNHILVLCSPIPAHTLCIEVRDAGWWLRRLVSEWMGRRRRWQFWRRELVFKLSMNIADATMSAWNWPCCDLWGMLATWKSRRGGRDG